MAEDTGIVTVSGLTNGQEAQLTVSSTRDGSLPGQSATTGFALRTARTPDLGTVQRRDGAIRVPITNFDADWEWTAEATEGDAAFITVEGVHLVEVTNLTDGEETTVTVTSTRDGWFDGTNTTTGEALDTELVPVLVDLTRRTGRSPPGSTTTTAPSTTPGLHLGRVGHGRVGELERRHRCGHRVRTDQRSRSPPDRGHHPHRLPRRQRRHRRPRPAHRPHPDIPSVTRTADGFTGVITNYDADFEWGATATVGTADIVEVVDGEDTLHVLRITGLEPSQRSVATVTTTRTGWFPVRPRYVGARFWGALAPAFTAPVRGSTAASAPTSRTGTRTTTGRRPRPPERS